MKKWSPDRKQWRTFKSHFVYEKKYDIINSSKGGKITLKLSFLLNYNPATSLETNKLVLGCMKAESGRGNNANSAVQLAPSQKSSYFHRRHILHFN